ncbi:MAG: hypothetical protein H6719_02610 [Sandaracinaceae bacterium]|nr:hypothetical protein [Sandaracinaceae bacterium]
MVDDLGERLVQAGLVTQRQLSQVLGTAPPHEGALVGGLVDQGLSQDGIAGFFVAMGFGPVMEPADLAAADLGAVTRISGSMALELLALPIRESSAGLVVAMAAPTDGHAVGELARATGEAVLPTVARVEDLREALSRAHPGQVLPEPEDLRESEPPVLELVNVRRRGHTVDDGYFGSTKGAERVEARATVGPKIVADDTEAFVPLVRTKPVRPAAPPPEAKPAEPEPEPRSEPARATPTSAKPASAKPPAAKDDDTSPELPRGIERRVVTKNFAKVPKDTRVVPVGTTSSTSPDDSWGKPEPKGRALRPPQSKQPPPKEKLAPSRRLDPARHGLEAADTEVQDEPPPSMPPPTPAPRSERAFPKPRSIIPEAHSRWESDESSDNKVDKVKVAKARDSRPPPKPAKLPEIGGTLSAIRASRDRDEVVELACQGALTISRATVLLALRKGVLKGWSGAGAGISADAVRNLWIPTSSPSMFRDVVAKREAYHGPSGTAAADGLFRAALGSRGGPVSLHPVVVASKLVAVLSADDVRFGDAGRERIETLARAVSEAFERIILEAKQR